VIFSWEDYGGVFIFFSASFTLVPTVKYGVQLLDSADKSLESGLVIIRDQLSIFHQFCRCCEIFAALPVVSFVNFPRLLLPLFFRKGVLF
jgi:hypothetical protein